MADAKWTWGHIWARGSTWPPAWDAGLINSGFDPVNLGEGSSRVASGGCCGGFKNVRWGSYGDDLYYCWQPFWYWGQASYLAEVSYTYIYASALIDDPLTWGLPPLYIYGRVIQNGSLDWAMTRKPRLRLYYATPWGGEEQTPGQKPSASDYRNLGLVPASVYLSPPFKTGSNRAFRVDLINHPAAGGVYLTAIMEGSPLTEPYNRKIGNYATIWPGSTPTGRTVTPLGALSLRSRGGTKGAGHRTRL